MKEATERRESKRRFLILRLLRKGYAETHIFVSLKKTEMAEIGAIVVIKRE
jgi:hypothetical protein